MKKTLLYSTLILSALTLSIPGNSQGMIVNEASNGTSGAEEFMEFLVVGATGAETDPVDLSGWIIDDNNGDFEGGGSGRGIAAGHIRIAAGNLTAVPPGSLILIYNSNDVHPTIASMTDDPTDSNSDGIYIIPISHSTFEQCTSLPSTSNSSYGGCAYSATTSASWSRISMSNSGDVAQVRRPDFSFYHGFSYGNVTAPFPTFPADLGGGSSFNAGSGGSGSSFALDCGAWTSSGNYIRNSGGSDSPGAANTVDNATLIANITAGANSSGPFDYGNLANPDNCLPFVLAVDLQAFNGEKQDASVRLDWNIVLDAGDQGGYFEILRSQNGVHFEQIGTLNTEMHQFDYYFVDEKPLPLNYYRLRVIGNDGSFVQSQIIAIEFENTAFGKFQLYPNPVTNGQATISSDTPPNENAEVMVMDMLGRTVHWTTFPQGENRLDLNLNNLEQGNYLLYIKTSNSAYVKRFVR